MNVQSYCQYCAYGECGDAPGYDPSFPGSGYSGQLMCGTFEPTNVISVSYGLDEADLPDYYMERQCNE